MMLQLLRRGSAPVARERLQILLQHERRIGQRDLVAILRDEIVAVVARHIAVDPDTIRVEVDRGAAVSLLEVDVEIPNSPGALLTTRS